MKRPVTVVTILWQVMAILAFGHGALAASAAAPSGQKLLDDLIARAKQEGVLNSSVIQSFSGPTGARLGAAFKKRFGLDIEVNLPIVDPTQYVSKAAAEIKAGVVPPYDTYVGSDKNAMELVALGGVQRIDNWEPLLAVINPLVGSGSVRPKQISHDPFSGFAFQYIHRPRAILYNPKVISRNDLPKTHAEIGDPKFKGRWVTPPYTSDWDTGPLAFPELPKLKWLEIVRKAGKNAGAVLSSRAAMQRVLLGETAATNNFYHLKAKDPQAPLEIAYFRDYNPVTADYYVVRKGARHPAVATLFALWMGAPDAEAIYQSHTFVGQLWGESEMDRKIRQGLQETGGKTLNFFDSKEGVELLRWYGTKEGSEYREAMIRAIGGE
jgi:ABC-type Fe3+ transport system substrate-binding protein